MAGCGCAGKPRLRNRARKRDFFFFLDDSGEPMWAAEEDPNSDPNSLLDPDGGFDPLVDDTYMSSGTSVTDPNRHFDPLNPIHDSLWQVDDAYMGNSYTGEILESSAGEHGNITDCKEILKDIESHKSKINQLWADWEACHSTGGCTLEQLQKIHQDLAAEMDALADAQEKATKLCGTELTH